MNRQIIWALCFFLASQTCIISAGFLIFAMIGMINERVPPEARISYWGGYTSKYLLILREYRRLYPMSRATLYLHCLFWSGMALLMGCAWQLGFFGHHA